MRTGLAHEQQGPTPFPLVSSRWQTECSAGLRNSGAHVGTAGSSSRAVRLANEDDSVALVSRNIFTT